MRILNDHTDARFSSGCWHSTHDDEDDHHYNEDDDHYVEDDDHYNEDDQDKDLLQVHTFHRLLAFNPCRPSHGLFLDTFRLPSACSCRLA